MLRAPWLGHWKAPWGLGRGRRWGDVTWALAAITQAWLLGGREGRWPRLEQEARGVQGPMVLSYPSAFGPRPDPIWVARLRRGSAGVPATERGPREDELVAWAWESLLAGDGAPWMAAGSVILDLPARLRWVAALAAVDDQGVLQLPPFLDFVPSGCKALPPGWWEFLLRSQDGEGRLLPEGPIDPGLPWPVLQRHAEPLLLRDLPEDLVPLRGKDWLFEGPCGWMLDPRTRAWGRGHGASPKGLAPHLSPSLAWGHQPDVILEEVLNLRPPAALSPDWTSALEADLQEHLNHPGLPPPLGHSSLDRLRMRWGGDAPVAGDGYPPWETLAHPCADPFHWMAQGQRYHEACEPERALRAFTLAYAHFSRLGSKAWAARAASNAALMALQWADLPAHGRWARLRGPLPQPWEALEQAQLAEVFLEPSEALICIQSLLLAFPGFGPAWGLLAIHGLDEQRWDLIREGLTHVSDHPYSVFLNAVLGPLSEDPPRSANPETRLSWEAHRLFRGHGSSTVFWTAWKGCPSRMMCLELGLQVLERLPAERSTERLLALQAIADRAGSARHQRRLAELWPVAVAEENLEPEALLQTWLAQQPAPAWITWEEEGRLQVLGAGEAPPEGLLGRLARDGALAPLLHESWVWRGYPLIWEGCSVGSLLLAMALEGPPAPALEAGLIAPWVACLRSRRPVQTHADSALLLTDGSEPMAGILRELDRVADSDLPVLILGPTGSGKELAAREVHDRSGRKGSLVPVNCSSLAEGLLESELFGHVRGAFTGADRDRRGAVETARGGTLFLDEVADLSPRLQSLLLRVLQEREVRRVGSDVAVKVDVRFVAATHRGLEDLVAAGSFRRDLWFRLQGAVLRLPPLSERRHEFAFLIPRLLLRAAQSAKRPVPGLAPGLAQALSRLPWPGNVRELLHALERAILRCEGDVLKPGHFPELDGPQVQPRTWEEGTRTFQRKLLLDTLRACEFRVADAAQSLGLARPALYAAAKRLGVDLVAERAHAHR